jgi:hypothetical protein
MSGGLHGRALNTCQPLPRLLLYLPPLLKAASVVTQIFYEIDATHLGGMGVEVLSGP